MNEQTKSNKNKHIDTENRVASTEKKGWWWWRAKWVKAIKYLVIDGK